MKGGKTETGMVPGGARAAATGFEAGGSPPWGVPGCGASGGATPGGGVTIIVGGDSLSSENNESFL